MRYLKAVVVCGCLVLTAGPSVAQQKPLPAGSAAASPLQPVLAWFERAHRDYQEFVIKELSMPTGKSAPPGGSRPPSLADKVMALLGLEAAKAPNAATPPPARPDDAASAQAKAEIDARINRQIAARDEEKRRIEEEERLAEAARKSQVAAAETKARELAAAQSRIAAAPAPQQPPAAAPRPTPPAAPQVAPQVAEAPPVAVPPKVEDPRRAAAVPPPPAAPERASESPAKLAAAEVPAHWNRLPRRSPQSGPSVSSAANKLARDATAAAERVPGIKSSPPKVLAVAHENKARSCSRAGRDVDPPATYTVKKGDSLWTIARRYYERGSRYVRIVRANDGRIADNPDRIYPCQKVYLPRRHAWAYVETQPS